MPLFGQGQGYGEYDEKRTAALAVLALEIARFHQHWASVASGYCDERALQLRSVKPLGHGWSLKRIGKTLGLASIAVKIMVYEHQ